MLGKASEFLEQYKRKRKCKEIGQEVLETIANIFIFIATLYFEN